uniref:Uncharacterized protein n=1 Tax=Pararge aegeria TaxID=116150 RepID=S4PKF7_9NEOP
MLCNLNNIGPVIDAALGCKGSVFPTKSTITQIQVSQTFIYNQSQKNKLFIFFLDFFYIMFCETGLFTMHYSS